MKGRMRVALALSAFGALASSSASAQTTPSDTALAIQLFEDAEKLMAAGNARAACPKYAESQKRDPQLGTLLHLADCQEKIGKLASAWSGYKEAADIAAQRNALGDYEPRESVARARAAALEPKVSTVVIHVPQAEIAGLEIRRNGEPVSRAVWGSTIAVDPGSYTFTAQAPGRKIWSKTVDVRAGGGKIDVTIPALEDDRAGSATASTSNVMTATDASPSAADGAHRGETQRAVGYFVAGLGVLGVSIGVAFGLRVLSQRDERDAICPLGPCTPEQGNQIQEIQNKLDSNATAFNVAVALGGAAMVGGLALVLTAPSSTSSGAKGVRVVPWGGPNSAGASIGGRW